MINQVREIFQIMTPQQRKRLWVLQILLIFMGFSEVVGVASIGPFMALVGNPTLIETNRFFAQVYQWSGCKTPYEFLFALGVVVLISLTLASIISMITTWRLAVFSFKVGTEIADRLYNYYMTRDWLFHASGSSAHLVKQLSTESFRLTAQVILPLMHMNAKVIMALCISLAMLVYNPVGTLVSVMVFLCAYFLLFKIVKISLKKNGTQISKMSHIRFRLMTEGFGGVKDILLLGRKDYFAKSFKASGEELAKASGINNALAFAPRYLMELLAFGILVSMILIMLRTNQGDLGSVLGVLAIYGLAGFKLLPALQNIYSAISEIRGNIAAFETLKADLFDSLVDVEANAVAVTGHMSPMKNISLKDVTFVYPCKESIALKNITIEIPAFKFVGFVGPSGAGKSTIIDLLLGLIQPKSGQLAVDGTVIDKINLRVWQNTIGFVPQSIFLSDGTIAENVAFGIPEAKIDYDQVRKVLKYAKLDDLVSELPKGLHTTVGERGVQLSGGQRQRIGIARALYNDASVLVFDEATSALDGVTEKLIMDAIREFSGKKTIIMIAHRLKTVEKCDTIFYLDNGAVRNQGTYAELLERDPGFREMANHA